jgi:hypothetical protein
LLMISEFFRTFYLRKIVWFLNILILRYFVQLYS